MQQKHIHYMGKITLPWKSGEFNLEYVTFYSGVNIIDKYYQIRKPGSIKIIAKYPYNHTGPLTEEGVIK